MSSGSLNLGQAAQEVVFFPASFAQQSLWFIDQLTPGRATYNVPTAVRIRGKVVVGLLQKTLEEIVRRHETLRTRFVAVRGEPQQVLEDQVNFQLQVLDLTHVSGEEQRESEAVRLAREEAQQPFNLEQAPLIRVKLLHLTALSHVLLLTMHHIIADAWSTGILVAEVSALYDAFSAGKPSPLPELPIQYADYAAWQREWLEGGVLEQQLAYWKQQLGGSSMLNLPTDWPRPAVQSQNGAMHEFVIDAGLAQKLKKLAEQQSTTLFMVLVATFQTLLYRYSGQDDISMGTPIAGRKISEAERLIGFFINTLVLRTDLSGAPSFIELLKRTREVILEAYAHQDVPFEKLVEVLSPERDLGSTPLFQVMITLQNGPQADLRFGTATLQPFNNVDNGTAKFDLLLQLAEDGSRMTGLLQYSMDLFEAGSITRMVGHYQMLLSGIATDPNQSIAVLPLLIASERKQVIEDWNRTEHAVPQEMPVELFQEQVQRSPEALAVIYEEKRLSYRELNERANRLAHLLIGHGVGPEDVVAISLERSVETVVAVLGVLKAGAAYLPLDPDYPPQRLAFMLEDAKPKLLLTTTKITGSFAEEAPRLLLDSPLMQQALIDSLVDNPTNRDRTCPLMPESPVYVIYTSGSTGQPKGIVMIAKAMTNLLGYHHAALQGGVGIRVAQFTSLSFDVSVQEILSALTSGKTLCIPREDVRRDPAEFVRWLEEHEIHEFYAPNVMMEAVREAVGQQEQEMKSLADLVQAGEALTPSEGMRDWFERSQGRRRLHNHYGPSETHVVTAYRLPQETGKWPARVPIGKPIWNTQTYVLDAGMQPVPVGVLGELYAGGSGLARGYMNRADLTAERFRPNPFSSAGGERLYRTGDLVRYKADGNLEFLGRVDHQVKIRGYRIELGEIEAALEADERVRQAVVMMREDATGDKRLVAYLVLNREIAANELRDSLKRRVPDYMVPSNFVILESFPLTASGKLNRAALPAPVVETGKDDPGASLRRSRATLEELLAQIWADVLRLDRVGVEDDFFALGGHSLLATQVVSRIRSAFHIDLPLRRLFEEPTVAGLAKVIEQQIQQGLTEKTPSLVRVPRDGPLPLSYGQQRLWFVHELAPDSVAYNVAGSVRISGPLNVELCNQVMTEILRRHESLRTRFIVVDQEPRQVIDEPEKFELPFVDLTALPPAERVEEAGRQARKESRRPFDLTRDRMLRFKVWRLGEEDHVLHVNMYHITVDIWSLGVLMREFSVLYDSFGQGKPSPLPELPIQYADFSAWQREWLRGEVLEQQLSYWKRQLANTTTLELPTDRPRSASMSYRGASVVFNLSRELTDKVKALGRRHGATLYMTLLSAYQLLLYRWSGQQDITLGSPIAGRRRVETETMIGFFVNVLVMRTDLSGGPTFVQLLRRVRDVTLEAYANQDVPFEKLVETIAPERDPSRSPFFQLMFFLQNAPMSDLYFGGRTNMEPFAAGTAAVKFDISVIMQETDDGMFGSAQYNTDLFNIETINGIVQEYQNLLTNIVDDPEQPIESYFLLPQAEYQRLLDEWNQPLGQEEHALGAASL